MEKEEFLRILKKYRTGRASPEEIRFLYAYYSLLDAGPDRTEALSAIEKQAIKHEIKHGIKAGIKADLKAGMRPAKADLRPGKAVTPHRKPRFAKFNPLKIAAAVLVLLSAGVYLYLQPAKPEKTTLVKNHLLKNDIAPGGNKATLTLADGKAVVLNEMKNGVLIKQGVTTVLKAGTGQLIYNQGKLPQKDQLYAYNTISTPRGGQYKVNLPDGTSVWLNAASSLKFPVAFTGKARSVELKGEAYFEVAEDKTRPFKITVSDVEIEVLGTHFNVMAYPDEAELTTTLLEGAVKISKNAVSKLLKPGQQASVGPDGRINITRVNTEEAVAWKNGYFLFDNEPLESIMRKISKWYDVEVTYHGKPEGLYFGGMVSRSKNLSEILKIMELTENIQFEINSGDAKGKGRRVIVMH